MSAKCPVCGEIAGDRDRYSLSEIAGTSIPLLRKETQICIDKGKSEIIIYYHREEEDE